MQLAEAGRGLALVDALCDRLTWQPNNGGGKVVRCHWRLKTATDTARSNPQPSGHPEGRPLVYLVTSPQRWQLERPGRVLELAKAISPGDRRSLVPRLACFCLPAITRRASVISAHLPPGHLRDAPFIPVEGD